MKIKCPKCNAQYDVPDNYTGKKTKCLKCGEHFVIKAIIDTAIIESKVEEVKLTCETKTKSEWTGFFLSLPIILIVIVIAFCISNDVFTPDKPYDWPLSWWDWGSFGGKQISDANGALITDYNVFKKKLEQERELYAKGSRYEYAIINQDPQKGASFGTTKATFNDYYWKKLQEDSGNQMIWEIYHIYWYNDKLTWGDTPDYTLYFKGSRLKKWTKW
jgi:predicted Zn finger-like uncharacterized protein